LRFPSRDTGIGIPTEKQRIIFEAFQQADGTTNRRYGGTGLACRSAAKSPGCWAAKFAVTAQPGEGSTFTLYLPRTYEQPGQWRLQ